MQNIQLDTINRPISKLVMGTDYFTPDIMEKVTDVLNNFIETGGNTIDTAFGYGGGKSEQAIGIWLEENKKRDDVILLTKGGHPDRSGSRVNKQAIDEELEISLERLRTNYVELYIAS